MIEVDVILNIFNKSTGFLIVYVNIVILNTFNKSTGFLIVYVNIANVFLTDLLILKSSVVYKTYDKHFFQMERLKEEES